MPTPLRVPSGHGDDDDEAPESPEALLISAMLEEGSFDPSRWHITEEDLACFKPLWKFCCDHQLRAGRAPAFSVVRHKFPDFVLTPDVDLQWAASKMREASASRQLRVKMREALTFLADDDLGGAYQALDGFMVPVNMRADPRDNFDATIVEDDFDVGSISVPWPLLGRATGGIRASEVWIVAARLGQGKTSITAGSYVARALKDGWNGIYHSMEMPASEISRKVNYGLASKDKELFAMISSDDRMARKKAIDILRERTEGTLGIYDQTHGTCDVAMVCESLGRADFVVIDHFGLMKMNGKAAVNDWRVAAEIADALMAATVRTGSRLIEIVQINRAGDSSSPTRTPKASELTDTDRLGHDASVIHTMNRFSASAMVHSTEKVRLGPQTKWYTSYLPAKGRYDQISRDRATELALEDDEREHG